MRHLTNLLPSAAWMLGCAACIGGQTGEGSPSPTTCIDVVPASLAVAADSPLGFSAGEVLQFAEAAHTFAVDWDGGATGTLELTRVEAPARFVDSEPDRVTDIELGCRGRVEVDVRGQLELVGETGGAQLTFDATLVADSPEVARLHVLLPGNAVAGDLRWPLAEGETLRAIEVHAVVSALGSSGQISAVAVHTEPPVGGTSELLGDAPRIGPYEVERIGTLARWPSGSACEGDELAVPLDQEMFGATPMGVLERLTIDAPLRWNGGGETRARFEATATTAFACLVPRCALWQCGGIYPVTGARRIPEGDAHYQLPITLSHMTDDGALVGTVATTLQYQVRQTGGFVRAWVTHSTQYDSVAALAADTGLTNLPPSDATRAWFSLQLEVTGSGAPAGELSVSVPGTNACAGQTMCTALPTQDTLARGQLGRAK